MTDRATGEEGDHRVELARARERIASLEARDAEHARDEPVQAALYRIAAAASGASDLHDFYRAIHAIVGELMDARNFYIALYDADRQAINFPYYVDTVDPDIPEPTRWEPFGVGNASGMTAYVLRNGRAIRVDTATWQALVQDGEIGDTGADSVEWLGAPLRHDGRTIGVIAVQTYVEGAHYEDRDVDVLVFVADHIASALARARAIEETRQRNAELALVNEIGLALASDLDFHAIIELVGERLRTTMQPDSMFIATVDNTRGWIDFPYTFEAGGRIDLESLPIGNGLTSRVIRERRPLRFGRTEETVAEGAIVTGLVSESWLGVPIIAGDDVIGVIVFEDPARDAFDEGDERLLGTLAAGMAVALRNAALFDETKRLLTETDERAAELAIINGVQQGLAAELDLQAMYELVGDKIQEIFDAQVVDIGIFDHERGRTSYPYAIERGVRFPDEADADLEPLPHDHRFGSTPAGGRRRDAGAGDPDRDAGRGSPVPPAGAARRGWRGSWPHLAPEPRQDPRLQRGRREAAQHDGVEPRRRPRERPPVRRDEAPPDRDRRARRRAGHHQWRPAGPRRGARPPGHV